MVKEELFVLYPSVAKRTNHCRICGEAIKPHENLYKFTAVKRCKSELAICCNCYNRITASKAVLEPHEFTTPYGNGENETASECIKPFHLTIFCASVPKMLHLNSLGFRCENNGKVYKCVKYCENAYFGKSQFTTFADSRVFVEAVEVENYEHWRQLVTGEADR